MVDIFNQDKLYTEMVDDTPYLIIYFREKDDSPITARIVRFQTSEELWIVYDMNIQTLFTGSDVQRARSMVSLLLNGDDHWLIKRDWVVGIETHNAKQPENK